MGKKKWLVLFLILIIAIIVAAIFFLTREKEEVEEEFPLYIEERIKIETIKGESLLSKNDSLCRTSEQIAENEMCSELLIKFAVFYKDKSYCDRLKENKEVYNFCISVLDESSRECRKFEDENVTKVCNLIKDVYFGEDIQTDLFSVDELNFAYMLVAVIKKDGSYCDKITETYRYEMDFWECVSYSGGVVESNITSNITAYLTDFYLKSPENLTNQSPS